MRKIFTKLVFAGVACFGMVSAFGQENKPVAGRIERKDFSPKTEIERE
ncbi:MAG: hypothetical protein LBE91_19160 [Tannerella sp.]|jgi:hypothetical protein|nr:hypothetical protein [Tannerella sp.]